MLAFLKNRNILSVISSTQGRLMLTELVEATTDNISRLLSKANIRTTFINQQKISSLVRGVVSSVKDLAPLQSCSV